MARYCSVTQRSAPIFGAWRLKVRRQWLANVRKEPGMGRTASEVECARLVKAEVAVHRQADIGGVRILLPIVLPPADRAQGERARRIERPQSAAWAAKTSLQSFPHLNGRKSTAPSLHKSRLSAIDSSSAASKAMTRSSWLSAHRSLDMMMKWYSNPGLSVL